MSHIGSLDTGDDGFLEIPEFGIAFRVQALLLDKLPEPLNQIEMWRVRRQKQQLYPQHRGGVLDQATALIARIVQHQGDRVPGRHGGNLPQQLTDALTVDVGLVDHGEHLVGDGIERPQHVEPLAATGGGQEQPHPAPDRGQKRPVDKVRGIYCKINC